MYTKQVPFKDFNNKPQTKTLHFNLSEREVFKLLIEFNTIYKFTENIKGDLRELETEEVLEFYNALEEILLSSHGTPSEDGLYFNKDDRYKFESSAAFNAVMVEFVSDPSEAMKLLDGLLPKGMDEIIKKSMANAEKIEKTDENAALLAEIERLKAQVTAPSE